MNRRELLLAQKSLGAREVKNIAKGLPPPYDPNSSLASLASQQSAESLMVNRMRSSIANNQNTYNSPYQYDMEATEGSPLRRSGTRGGMRQQPKRRPGTTTVLATPFSPVNTRVMTASASTSSLSPSMASTSSSSVAFKLDDDESIGDYSPSSSFYSLSPQNQTLVKELSNRSLTAEANLRKMQINVKKSLVGNTGPISTDNERQKNAKLQNRQPPPFKFDDNYFMPKRSIQRPDGATLSDVYNSKREDTWGKIIRAQALEDVRKREQDHKDKLMRNEKFGTLLRKQLEDNRRRFEATAKANDNFANLEEETSRRSDAVQKARREDAIRRHKQFIANALEDIEIKRKKREEEYLEDMKASQFMIQKAQYMIQLEEEKKKERRELETKRHAEAYQENLDSIARKAALKQWNSDEDKRIFAVAEKMHLANETKKQESKDLKTRQATDGPAHKVVHELVQLNRAKEDAYYNRLSSAPNMLNRQLKNSEDSAKARAGATGKYLWSSWETTRMLHEKETQELNAKNEEILRVQKQRNLEAQKEDERKREAKRQAGLMYQRELDAQLNDLRSRSLGTLTKTMSDREIAMNMDLFRKLGINTNNV